MEGAQPFQIFTSYQFECDTPPRPRKRKGTCPPPTAKRDCTLQIKVDVGTRWSSLGIISMNVFFVFEERNCQEIDNFSAKCKDSEYVQWSVRTLSNGATFLFPSTHANTRACARTRAHAQTHTCTLQGCERRWPTRCQTFGWTARSCSGILLRGRPPVPAWGWLRWLKFWGPGMIMQT